MRYGKVYTLQLSQGVPEAIQAQLKAHFKPPFSIIVLIKLMEK